MATEHAMLAKLRWPGSARTSTPSTRRRGVLRSARRHRHDDLPPDGQIPGDADAATIEQELIVAERNAAPSAAFAELGPNCHDLLSLLVSDPPLAYAHISTMLGIPVGSIDPKRARCMAHLKRSPHLARILRDRTSHAEASDTADVEGWDDEEILEALRQAVENRQAIPVEFVTAAKNAFAC